MSSQTTQPSSTGIQKEDIPDLVYEALTDRFSNQDRRSRGVFLSQSYRELMRFVDPDDIQRVVADRRIVSHTNEIPLSGGLSDCLKAKTPEGVSVELKYDKSDSGLSFEKYHGHLMNWFERYDDVYDLPIREVVIRIDNEPLRDQLLDVLKSALDFNDPGAFKAPFYAVMRSKAPGDALYQKVRDHHNGKARDYFKKPDEGDVRGLGWPTRCLDLVALWSSRVWAGHGDMPFKDVSMRDIEELAINNVETDRRVYGAINSPLVINKWQRAFTAGTTDEKRWEWEEREGWERTR